MKVPKVLIFSLNYYPKFLGGAEVAIKEIVERIDKDRYEFHMITLRFDSNLPKYEIIHGIHIHRIGLTKKDASAEDLNSPYLKLNKYIFQVYAPLYASKLHMRESFSAVWAMMAHSSGIPAGIFKTFFPKVKYILSLQEGDPPEHIEALAKPFPKPVRFLNYFTFTLFQRAFTKADTVQAISTFLLNWARSMGYCGYGVVIPNAVDIKEFTRAFSDSEVQEVKNKLGKQAGEVWLISTSRLVHKNGLDDCINALKMLPAKYHFAILGMGVDEKKLKKLASDLNISDRVHFVGQIGHPLMSVYLKACDIFIRPSRSEGMGNSFVEAMSMKMPVIATTEGGLSDFIFDGKTAWVVSKDSPESIKEAVLRIEEGGNRQQIIDTAFDMVVEKYNWDLIAKRMGQEVFSKV